MPGWETLLITGLWLAMLCAIGRDINTHHPPTETDDIDNQEMSCPAPGKEYP